MEFGALQCKPVPECLRCPMKKGCVAFQQNRVAEFPVKSKKQGQRIRYFHYLVIFTGNKKNPSIFINKRIQNDIWKNLFDFPMIETERAISYKKLILQKEWNEIFSRKKVVLLSESKIYRHILSHQVIVAKFYQLKIASESGLPFKKIFLKDLDKYPVPRLIEKYFL
jgi:A/G-specific adenine glycosylase